MTRKITTEGEIEIKSIFKICRRQYTGLFVPLAQRENFYLPYTQKWTNI